MIKAYDHLILLHCKPRITAVYNRQPDVFDLHPDKPFKTCDHSRNAQVFELLGEDFGIPRELGKDDDHLGSDSWAILVCTDQEFKTNWDYLRAVCGHFFIARDFPETYLWMAQAADVVTLLGGCATPPSEIVERLRARQKETLQAFWNYNL
jgi:hypothetical protein